MTFSETPSRAKEFEDRLTTLTLYLSRELGAHELYAVIDPVSIGSEIDKARATQALDRCNGCERDLARLRGEIAASSTKQLEGGTNGDGQGQHQQAQQAQSQYVPPAAPVSDLPSANEPAQDGEGL